MLEREQARWRLRPGQLLIVDEASLAGTLALDTLARQAAAAGAKVLLVGDHHQLSAVEAGGAFGLLARHTHASHLEALWRFRHRWEAHATRLLRDGDPNALDAYAAHGRLHDGPTHAMLEAAYQGWRADIGAGRSALLVAADNTTVTDLNARARADRIHTGQSSPTGVMLRDGTTAGVGDPSSPVTTTAAWSTGPAGMSETATSGPSPASAATATWPSSPPTTRAAPSTCPPTTSASTSSSATRSPSTAPKAAPSTMHMSSPSPA